MVSNLSLQFPHLHSEVVRLSVVPKLDHWMRITWMADCCVHCSVSDSEVIGRTPQGSGDLDFWRFPGDCWSWPLRPHFQSHWNRWFLESLPALKFVWLSSANFWTYWKIACIFHFEDIHLESLLYLILLSALSGHAASSFFVETVFLFLHSLCTARRNVCLTHVSAMHFQNCLLGKFKWKFKVSLRMQTINSFTSCRHLYIVMTKKGSG